VRVFGSKLIALSGAESTGKTALAMQLAGRLRARGLNATYSAEPGAALPFAPSLFDTAPLAHVYTALATMTTHLASAARAGTDVVICDRAPMDFVFYLQAKHPEFHGRHGLALHLQEFAAELQALYQVVYVLPAQGSEYVEDGRRAAQGENTWRAQVDALFMNAHTEWPKVQQAQLGLQTQRERAEWVYHHLLAELTGETRPLRAYHQVHEWFTQQGVRVLEVRPQGSQSLTRFHAPSDHDDFDVMLVVDGDVAYAQQVRALFLAQKEHLENVVQGDLDVLVTPKGLEAHEV